MMMPPIWVCELAERFGHASADSYPRDLRPCIHSRTPLVILERPSLRLQTVRETLAQLRIGVCVSEPDRPLRACLFCRLGSGFIFLDSTDPPDEQRFSLAHELAHYLADYDAVRRRVVQQLGPATLEVLDGKRAATFDEQLHSVLRNVAVGPHFHVMERDDSGRPKSHSEREAEERADRLAFELLAPAKLLFANSDPTQLMTEFGLPARETAKYVSLLWSSEPRTWVDGLTADRLTGTITPTPRRTQ
jgi:hypothetical protein